MSINFIPSLLVSVRQSFLRNTPSPRCLQIARITIFAYGVFYALYGCFSLGRYFFGWYLSRRDRFVPFDINQLRENPATSIQSLDIDCRLEEQQLREKTPTPSIALSAYFSDSLWTRFYKEGKEFIVDEDSKIAIQERSLRPSYGIEERVKEVYLRFLSQTSQTFELISGKPPLLLIHNLRKIQEQVEEQPKSETSSPEESPLNSKLLRRIACAHHDYVLPYESYLELLPADLTVLVGADKAPFPLHRACFDPSWHFWECLFSNSWKEGIVNQYKLPDIEVEVFQAVVEFIYTRKVSLQIPFTPKEGGILIEYEELLKMIEKCEALRQTARFLEMRDFEEYCLKRLLSLQEINQQMLDHELYDYPDTQQPLLISPESLQIALNDFPYFFFLFKGKPDASLCFKGESIPAQQPNLVRSLFFQRRLQQIPVTVDSEIDKVFLKSWMGVTQTKALGLSLSHDCYTIALTPQNFSSHLSDYLKIAEEDLGLGRWLGVEISPFIHRDPQQLKPLLQQAGHLLDTLDLSNCQWVNRDILVLIAAYCPYLDNLNLSWCSQVTDEGLEFIFQNCKRFRSLYLRNCEKITSHSLLLIAQTYPQLKRLDIRNCSQINEQGIEAIVSVCSNLSEFYIDNSIVSDKDVEQMVQHCKKLKGLSFGSNTLITGKSLQLIAQHYGKQIETFNLQTSQISEEHFCFFIQSCRQLEMLSLRLCHHITDRSLGFIAQQKKLKGLNIVACEKVTDQAIHQLVLHCEELEALDISACSLLTEETVKNIAENCKNLKTIGIAHFRNIKEKHVRLLAQKCPKLTLISFATQNSRYRISFSPSFLEAMKQKYPRLTIET